MLKFDQNAVSFIANALTTAATKYAECEQQAREAGKGTPADSGFNRMADQFKRQRQQAEKLAQEFMDYDSAFLSNAEQSEISHRAAVRLFKA